MRPVNIVLLVLAGAIGGAVVMRVAQRPQAEQFASAPESSSLAAPAAPEAIPDPAPPAQPSADPADVAPVVAPEPTPSEPVRAKSAPVRRTHIVPKHLEFQRPSESHSLPAPQPTVVAQVQTPPPAAAPTPPQTPEQPKETPPGNMEPEEVTPLPAPIFAPPEPHTVTLNAGMFIPVRLVDSLSLDRNQAGDRFAATLDRELDADGFVIAERGARVEGRVVLADRTLQTLSIELTRVTMSDRQDVTIQTERFDKRNQADHGQDMSKVGAGVAAGAVIGAVIGGIAGGGKGAAIGAGVGGGAGGAGGVMLSRKPVALSSETRITFRLRAPVTITERHD